MRALLDVNVLIALLDAAHVHHRLATSWLGAHIEAGWASCPLTQLGCVRIMSQPGYPNSQPAAQVAARLRSATQSPHHVFWPADVDALHEDRIDWRRILSSRQVTDCYLLGLAVAQSGCFVTFDRHVVLTAVAGASRQQVVVVGAP